MDEGKGFGGRDPGSGVVRTAWRGLPVELICRRITPPHLQVLPDGTLRVTAPAAGSIESILEAHAAWIHRKIARMDQVSREHPDHGERFLLEGEYYEVRQGPSCSVDREAQVITYTTPLALKRALTTFLRAELMASVSLQSGSLGVRHQRISVRMQKTRWASCSSRGTLSFNLVCAALPMDLREYIVAHELAHLREPNHSRQYWALLETQFRGAREADRRLRKFWILIGRNRYWRVLRDLGAWESAFRRRASKEPSSLV